MKLRTWHNGKYKPILKFSFTTFWILQNSQPVNLFVISLWHCSTAMFQVVAIFGLQQISRSHADSNFYFIFHPFSSQYSQISSTLSSKPPPLPMCDNACDNGVQNSLKDFTVEGLWAHPCAAAWALARDHFLLGDLCLHRCFLNFHQHKFIKSEVKFRLKIVQMQNKTKNLKAQWSHLTAGCFTIYFETC